jgi:double-stranded uracil-DNA glycosylase
VNAPPVLNRRPTASELPAYEGATVDDLLADPLRLLFVGINPGLWTAAVNAHFARPGNRFWPALHRAGITPAVVDASEGLRPPDREALARAGVGITNIVGVATARADQLTAPQLREGGERLHRLVESRRPSVVAVLGITAYRRAFGRRDAVLGRQDEELAGAELWVLGNPSGLNAHETVETLADAFRRVALVAHVPLVDGSPSGPTV